MEGQGELVAWGVTHDLCIAKLNRHYSLCCHFAYLSHGHRHSWTLLFSQNTLFLTSVTPCSLGFPSVLLVLTGHPLTELKGWSASAPSLTGTLFSFSNGYLSHYFDLDSDDALISLLNSSCVSPAAVSLGSQLLAAAYLTFPLRHLVLASCLSCPKHNSWTGGVAHVVQHLPSKGKALSLNPSTTNK
jgi:hypothetical protein